MKTLQNLATALLRLLESRIDAWALSRIAPSPAGSVRWRRAALWTTIAIGAAGAIWAVEQRAWLQVQWPGQAVAADSRLSQPSQAPAALPTGLRRQGPALIYTCQGKEAASRMSSRLYDFSAIFDREELQQRLIADNRGAFQAATCKVGAEVQIPAPLLAPLQNAPIGDVVAEPVRAVYLSGDNMRPSRLAAEVRRLRSIGANGVVFDVKDVIGVVNYRSAAPNIERYRRYDPPIRNIQKTIRYLHENGMFVIARTALFQDQNLATQRPDLAIHDRNAAGGILLVKGRPLWVDPGQEEVRSYNLGLVQELIGLGVDEIQFDYVRYPAEGNLSGVSYHGVQSPHDKTGFLARFLAGAWLLTRASNTRLSIDIFGIVAWGEEVDVKSTGQRIERLSRFVDILSPMLYPSHFHRGWGGIANPADEPFRFYNEGVQRFKDRARSGIVIRPWVQAFKWRVTRYNEEYIRQQIAGSSAAGGRGWMMWNAGNDYDMVYSALRHGESLTTQRSASPQEAVPGG
ncbi:MAG: putative glycoside hydrolase [Leptospirales bacterium]|nr:putative glycoside hydrolase [Leptospirales bacterium]